MCEEEQVLQCPVCSSAIDAVPFQQGVYECPNCGEIEEEEGGFIVSGQFYPSDITKSNGYSEFDISDGTEDELKGLGEVDMLSELDEFGESDEIDFDPSDELTIGNILADIDIEIESDMDDLEDTEGFGEADFAK